MLGGGSRGATQLFGRTSVVPVRQAPLDTACALPGSEAVTSAPVTSRIATDRISKYRTRGQRDSARAPVAVYGGKATTALSPGSTPRRRVDGCLSFSNVCPEPRSVYPRST